jgi:hypothetical protein
MALRANRFGRGPELVVKRPGEGFVRAIAGLERDLGGGQRRTAAERGSIRIGSRIGVGEIANSGIIASGGVGAERRSAEGGVVEARSVGVERVGPLAVLSLPMVLE